MEELGYPEKPVVVKPPASKGQRGFRILVGQPPSMDEIYNSKPYNPYIDGKTFLEIYKRSGGKRKLLVTEYLPGREYTVDMLLKNGKPLVIVPRERVKIVQGISVISRVVRNQELINAAAAISEALKFDYVINIQFKYSRDGVPKLLEINPRIAGTVCASIEAGAHMPYLAIKLAMGEPIGTPSIKWGLLFIRYWDHVALY